MGTAETARRWARVWRRAWPEQDVEAIAALQAEHGDHWASMFRHYMGRDGLRAYLAECFAEETRPAEVWFGEPVVTGDLASVEYWAVTYPGGEPLTISGCTVLLVGAHGLIAESRDYSHAQPGAVAPPARLFLPEVLRGGLDVLRRAYPDGLPGGDYRPLLAALDEDLSDRNLAALVAAFLGGDPLRVGNDLATLGGDRPPSADVARVRETLLTAGWAPTA
ncbi:DUF3349 domain-containing protein [Actinoplanes hulinensis]|uniref:DUF3349 domain-containing protein n=1 Tax=Actinoplanes hulinensis TaxID=1144547 RepID=A0ABS7B4E1_9ACTN|nr:nuclear transport factor 2 family protein [Actinoplanes hulinensis]MBW6435895.1 DUF3349 domain-containing protein [Actinoplanes hulinensis]